MSAQAYPMFDRFQARPRMIAGVCGWLAERATLPVWVVRVLALIMFFSQPPVMFILYFGLAIWLRGQSRGTWRSYQAPVDPVPDSVVERFRRLDRRLAAMEAAVVDRELGLRRAFQELDRHR